MKRFKQVILLLLLLTVSASASAQLRFGVKAGLNLANNKASDLWTDGVKSTLDTENFTGAFLGPTLELMSPLGIGFDLALLYSQKGTKYEVPVFADFSSYTFTVKDKLHYLDIPLNLKYKLSLLDIVGFYATAGPYLSWAMSGTRSIPTEFEDYRLVNKDFYKRFDYGVGVGVGAELFNTVQVGFGYTWGFTNTAKERLIEVGDVSSISYALKNTKNRVFNITVGVLF